jgi:AsmA family
MQQTDPTHATEPIPAVRTYPLRRRLLHVALVLLVLAALIFGPPLVNISRYQRRIATSISNSLGRPVHLDRVSLSLFPLPGFTIENLVVGEDPAFGSEPIIRANEVHASVRFSSLWRRQIEFSTIRFTDPSVNLVHSASGQWNIEGVLLQAARIETAPTAQPKAGPAPRFPYIEATGARLNFKEDPEKLPFSLVDADFALWLPDPHQWHLRLRARPTRTDSSVSDTGTIELESTLSAATSLAQVPVNLQGQWRNAPLGEASRVLFGHDLGWRGDMSLSANIRGTLSESAVSVHLHLTDTRRADFVPQQSLDAQAECFATATGLFHAFEDIRCAWPPAATGSTPTIALTGSIPNVHTPRTAKLQAGTSGIPASTLLSWLRIASPKVPNNLTAAGTLSGSFTYNADGQPNGQWQGELTLRDAGLTVPQTGSQSGTAADSLITGDLLLRSPGRTIDSHPHRRTAQPALPNTPGFQLAPASLELGGREPAILEGHFDANGYTLHLTGMATGDRLEALAQAVPALSEALSQAVPANHSTNPTHIDVTTTHPWGAPQTSLAASTLPSQAPHKSHTR